MNNIKEKILKHIKTCDLVEELMQREGVAFNIVFPEQTIEFDVTGPVIVIKVYDTGDLLGIEKSREIMSFALAINESALGAKPTYNYDLDILNGERGMQNVLHRSKAEEY